MVYEYLEVLMYLAKKAGVFKQLETSTIKAAEELSTSQQTISRKLREMEKLGLIKRTASQKGLIIEMDKKGRKFLRQHYRELAKIFSEKQEIRGTVKSGVREGRYYVNLPQYQEQFRKKLGFRAYPGTLNVSVDKADAQEFISSLSPVNIRGFETKDRTFGDLTAYRISIKGTKAAIIIPERTRHGDEVIEIIAPVNLRKRLRLKDSSRIRCQKQ